MPKRSGRDEGIAGVWRDRLAAATRVETHQLLHELVLTRGPLGLASTPKRQTIAAQVCEFKQSHPERIVLVRVADFYEAWGVDAAILIDVVSHLVRHKTELKVVFHASRIQEHLNALIGHRLTAAVYEETPVLCTPRHRALSQIVTAATPQYGASEADAPAARPIAALYAHPTHDCVSVCLLDVPQRLCRRMSQVAIKNASALVAGALRPLYVLRHVPAWLRNDETVLLGLDAHTDLAERLVRRVAEEHHLKWEEFRIVCAHPSRVAPLTRFTLQQLGLRDQLVPSLVDHALPHDANAAVRQQLGDWLASPPEDAHVAIVRELVTRLLRPPEDVPMPRMAPSAAGRRFQCIQSGHADVGALRGLFRNACAVLESRTLCEGLVEQTKASLGWGNVDWHSIDALRRLLRETLHDEPQTMRDARGPSHQLVVNALHDAELDDLRRANAELDAHLVAYHADELVRDARGVALRGRANGDDRLPVHDKNHRVLPMQYTTLRLQLLENAVAIAARQALDDDAQAIRRCVDALGGHLPTICVVEAVVLTMATLVEHVKLARRRRWCPLECVDDDDTVVELEGLRPYWMETAVTNPIALRRGEQVVLTAPNGGGKTTLLRAIGACAALHACGLASPVIRGRMGRFDQLYLRAGALDAVHERHSSFTSEMIDWRGIMEAPGQTLALVDEPCRGTSTAEGMRLLAAILSHMRADATCMVSTHYHELCIDDNPRIRPMQLGARVVDADCVPDYVLREGRCVNSLALRVALAVGLPIEIVRSARARDDVDTLLLAVMTMHNVEIVRLDPSTQTAPPHFHSTLYAIDTVDGVYVGESDDVWTRMCAHHRQKPCIRNAYVAACDDKTRARALEAAVINELRFHDLTLLSDKDGRTY